MSKSFSVTNADRQLTVAAFVRLKLSLTWTQAKQLIAKDLVYLNGQLCRQVDHRLKPGFVVAVREPEGAAPPRPKPKPKPEKKTFDGPQPKIVYFDADIVVVDKPAGLTTVRHADEAKEFGAGKQKFLPVTLAELLPDLLHTPGKRVIAVHRIDKDTSGLLVFARNRTVADALDVLFRNHKIERRYLGLTRGTPPEGRIESWIVDDRGDGRRGSGEAGEGEQAVTFVKVLETGEISLVECTLETGRTHQVRIHLGEAGAPLCGERIYDRPVNGNPLPDPSKAKRHMLHAAVLGFEHPTTGEAMRWLSQPPEDMISISDKFLPDA